MELVSLQPTRSRPTTTTQASSSKQHFHTHINQTNGTAEQVIRTIVTIGRSMLHHAKLDKCFWAEAAMMIICVKKRRLPSPNIAHKTPFEIVYSPSQVSSICGIWLSNVHTDSESKAKQVGSQGSRWIIFRLQRSFQEVSSL